MEYSAHSVQAAGSSERPQHQDIECSCASVSSSAYLRRRSSTGHPSEAVGAPQPALLTALQRLAYLLERACEARARTPPQGAPTRHRIAHSDRTVQAQSTETVR
jgi:hypothetical protein